MCGASFSDAGCVRDLEPQLYGTVAPPVSALDETLDYPDSVALFLPQPPLLQQPPAWMHAHARDGINPWLPRFTDVLSQAGAALALKMLLLRFIVLNLNFVRINARLYLKRKKKREKERKKKNTQKSNHCSLSLSSSVVSFECGGTKAPWSSLVSEMFGNFSFVSVRSFVICSCPLSEQGALKRHDGACLLQESFADCGNWPENLVGAKHVALNLFFLSPTGHLCRG